MLPTGKMSGRSRSRSGARSPILRGDVTDFEDLRTTPERERASSSAAAAHDRAPRKLWSRTQLRRLPCPLDGLRQCFLRVTPPRRHLRHPDAELRRHDEELRLSFALGRHALAPLLEQGEVFRDTAQLAFVQHELGTDLHRFARLLDRPDAVLQALARRLADEAVALANAGVFHGDVKPENVLVFEEAGRLGVKFIDFDPKYVSTHEKDRRLRERLATDSQLAALYAVGTLGLLLLHLKTLGHTNRNYAGLYRYVKNEIGQFHIYVPGTHDLQSKYFRLLVRNLRHYKLLQLRTGLDPSASGSRAHFLKAFWDTLVRAGLKTQRREAAPSYRGEAFAPRWLAHDEAPPPLQSTLREMARAMTESRGGLQ